MPEGGDVRPAPSKTPTIVIAFDFGRRRIGIASGDTLTRSASPRTAVDSAPTSWWTRLEAFFGIHPESADALPYEGHDEAGIPRYSTQPISAEDSLVLRRAYGIENPHRLYLSDSSDTALLKYDTEQKACRSCLVDSYDVGFRSVRRPDESWEQVERRVKAHILVAFLGYALWVTLKHLLMAAHSDLSPANALALLSTLISADIVLPTTDGRQIRLRRITSPDAQQTLLLHQLGVHLPERLRSDFQM